jgi:carboxylesterase
MSTKLPRVSKKGYILNGPGPQVLLFHGYTGSPYDLKPLALFLNGHGAHVSVPLLAGHGTKASQLSSVTKTMWQEQAQGEITKLNAHRPIIIGGLSMGACLAIIHAFDSPAIKALLLFSPALCLKLSAELLISATRLGIISKQWSIPKRGGASDIADPLARAKCPSYAEMPIQGLLAFDDVRSYARDLIKKLTKPVFMAFGRNDNVINLQECVNYIKYNIKSRLITRFYNKSQHVITLDYDRDILSHDVLDFINIYGAGDHGTHRGIDSIS